MNKRVILAFLSGAVIGGFLTYRYVTAKTIEEQPEEPQITLVTKPAPKMAKPEKEEKDISQEPEKSSLNSTSVKDSEDRNFTDYVNMAKAYKEPEEDSNNLASIPVPVKPNYQDLPKPYVIDPNKLGENDDGEEVEIIELMYYDDGVLADEQDMAIDVDDVDNMVGISSLEHFGEYEEDSVAVRNERLNVDYLILRSLKTYSEVEQTLPPSMRRKGLDGED